MTPTLRALAAVLAALVLIAATIMWWTTDPNHVTAEHVVRTAGVHGHADGAR